MAKRYEKAREYTEKYKSALLPCRICGNENIVIVSDREIFYSKGNLWSVCCSTRACDCTKSFTSVREAVKRWNELQRKEDKK